MLGLNKVQIFGRAPYGMYRKALYYFVTPLKIGNYFKIKRNDRDFLVV